MQIAAQLYTVRDFTRSAKDLDETLGKVAQIGYEAVQLSAVEAMNGTNPQVDVAAARQMLDNHGLTCVATHRPWRRLTDSLELEIEGHRVLGCDYLAVGSIADDFGRGLIGLQEFAAASREAIAALTECGIRFGYHNHDHEFERVPGSRKTAFDVLIEESDPRLEFEIDTYWVQNAGIDPAALLRNLSGRIAMVHLKDKAVVNGLGPVMAPVGEGNIDWDAVLAACEAGGTEYVIVEQDSCRTDPFDCLKSSFEYLREKL